ncbi:Nup85p [Saccharomyces cerevisiae x Saccharomyces kudriavzevii VIN7]|uniref:Nuclear pore complex protein Nup85 n=1 Tax=Saccharomyces cerevisiae x Saccharomyces kudriavzevii (strain VIN7) TaxID=1095631 RepID=H0GWZ9_SACCK|nr:Nup85p [Saccharomyces cerevisiae x Saccharomyces kudriavzevii VIN7]
MAVEDSELLLIDVDQLDFLDDGTVQKNDDMADDDEEQFYERDPVSGAILVPMTINHQPIKKDGEKVPLKFRLGPISTQNMGFITAKDNYKLYPVKIPRVDTSKEFTTYVSGLFEIYRDLGDHRAFNVPTIGVVNSNFAKEHNATVNLAMEAILNELEVFINSIKDQNGRLNRFYELEESLTVLNCLKTMYFTLDGQDIEEDRPKFIESLLNWINRSDGEPDEEYIEQVFSVKDLKSGKKVFETQYFWKLLNQLVLRGLLPQAIGCIERSHILTYLNDTCAVSFDAIGDSVELLKQYPRDSSNTFREWKNLVLKLGQAFGGSATTISGELRDYIEDFLLVMGGNQRKILQYSRTWYESFCGFLLYYIPSLELSAEYLQVSLESNAVDVTNDWEQSCVDIIGGKIHSILPVMESLDSCTAAFTAMICEAKGLIENVFETNKSFGEYGHEDNEMLEDLFSYKNGMASYMLNSFAFELCSLGNKELWPVAIGLVALSLTGTRSAKKMVIAELLPHYPFVTNDDIEWMLSICVEWRLPEIAKEIYTTLGNQMLSAHNIIESIANFSKAGRFELVKSYSWLLFEASCMQGRKLDDPVLNAIVSNSATTKDDVMIPEDILNCVVTNAMRQTLAPYAVLSQFYEASDSGDWDQALHLLLLLIEFPYLPKHYLVLLVAKFLYPIFLLDDKKTIDENSVAKIIDVIETEWDENDEKSSNLYETIIQTDKILPDSTAELLKNIRKKLNFKLCQAFM